MFYLYCLLSREQEESLTTSPTRKTKENTFVGVSEFEVE